MGTAADSIQVASTGETVYARVIGRGTFKLSPALKEFATSIVDQGGRQLVVDMSQCVGMDSTFMGVLAGLSIQLKKKQAGRISLVNLSAKIKGLITTLGLDHMVEAHLAGDTPEAFSQFLEAQKHLEGLGAPEDTSPGELKKIILQAHENLVDIDEKNLDRFRDVLTYLRQEEDND